MNSDLVRWLLDIDLIPAGTEGLQLAWERPFPAWLWMLMVIGAAALALWSYRRLTGRRSVALLLAGTRFLLIVLILIVVSGPTLEHPRESVEEDWVLMLLDRSRSMGIADAATADGRISREEQLEGLLQDNEQMWRDIDAARRLVWLGFHVGAFNLGGEDEAPVTPDPTEEALAGPAWPSLGEAVGEGTNLDAAIEQALQQAAARPLSGVVVFSDGRTTDPPSRSLIRKLQSDSVPVFGVALGSSEPVGDLAIRRVEAPRRAFIRDKVPVIVEVDELGVVGAAEGASLALVDTLTGEELDRVELTGDTDEDRRVTLTAQPRLAGEATWEVVLETDRPDLIPDNNLKPFEIELIDRPLRVLYVDGYPRWEYRFLKNLLIREKSIESSVMLLSADRDFAQEGNQPITRLPRSPDEFERFDVIVIGDVPGGFFSMEQLEMMRDQVAENGTGLLWVGGERYMPRTYTGSGLSDLLPMRGALALAPLGEAVNMEPTPLADRLGVLRVTARGEVGWPEDLRDPNVGWSTLRWAQRIDPANLKATAEVLARTTEPVGADQMPLVVHMRYGAGQTIYVATDEIWRWRYGRGELLPEQFWIQMIRMLGRESLVGSGERGFLEAGPNRVAVQQPVRLQLRLMDGLLANSRRQTVGAEIIDPDGNTVGTIELERMSDDEEQYAVTYLPNVTGELTVRLTDPDLASLDLEAVVDVFAPDDELRRPETDHRLLAELTAATGGAMLTSNDLGGLAERLPNRSVRTINPLTERIWDTPLFFGLIVLLLTIEWIGRKAARLP